MRMIDVDNPLVIYHDNCWDGFCAAWLLHLAYPNAEFFPAQYGNPPPDVKGRSVFVVDFSYPRQMTLGMIHDTRGRIVILDHHKTAEEELKDVASLCYKDTLDQMPWIEFDMNRSGGRMTWEYLCTSNRIVDILLSRGHTMGCGLCRDKAPWLVDYTEDRDLWRHSLPDTKELNAYLRSLHRDFDLWDSLSLADESALKVFASSGSTILRIQDQVVDHHVSKAYEMEMDGHKILAVNATIHSSEIAGKLAIGRPFGATYFCQQNQRIWSLRSSHDGIDVSAIAKLRGGGGHARASGFQERIN